MFGLVFVNNRITKVVFFLFYAVINVLLHIKYMSFLLFL